MLGSPTCEFCGKRLFISELGFHGKGRCTMTLTNDMLERELRRLLGSLAKIEFKPGPPMAYLTVIEATLRETYSIAIPDEQLSCTLDEVSRTWLEPFARAVLGLPKKSEKLTYPPDNQIEEFATATGYAATDSFKLLVRRVVNRSWRDSGN